MAGSWVPPRRWPVAAALALAGLGVHLWGLYRVSGPPTVPWFPGADKVEHLVGFGVPLLLVLVALDARARAAGSVLRRRTVVVVAAAFAVHGVVSELVQHAFYARRTGDPADTAADWAGVALGLLVLLSVRRGGRGRA